MISLGGQLLEMQLPMVTIISCIFLVVSLMDKDELEQVAFNNALKISTIIVVISSFGYGLYMLSVGYKSINIYIFLCIINAVCTLTLILYYLNLKDISFEFKIRNERLAVVLMCVLGCISVLGIISVLFEFRFFENPKGFIRYDELILKLNAIILSITIPLLSKRKKMNREEYKKMEKDNNRFLNKLIVIYVAAMILIFSYLVYKRIVL